MSNVRQIKSDTATDRRREAARTGRPAARRRSGGARRESAHRGGKREGGGGGDGEEINVKETWLVTRRRQSHVLRSCCDVSPEKDLKNNRSAYRLDAMPLFFLQNFHLSDVSQGSRRRASRQRSHQ